MQDKQQFKVVFNIGHSIHDSEQMAKREYGIIKKGIKMLGYGWVNLYYAKNKTWVQLQSFELTKK
jgi:hypothetical protein